MMFSYKCNVCGARIDSSSRNLTTCPECLSMALRRDYASVQVGARAFRPHFNHAVGAYVETSRQFDEQLKAHSERHGAAITRVDPGDVSTPSRDTEILETQARTIHDKRINPAELT